jgi:hypothetical protein
MIPKKGKTYAIACLGPYDYNKFKGTAKYSGITESFPEDNDVVKIGYGFEIDGEPDLCFFVEDEILAEAPTV